MKAWELLSEPGVYKPGLICRDKEGNYCPLSEASAFSVYGAIAKTNDDNRITTRQRLLDSVGAESIYLWEQGKTQSQVVAKLKELDI